MLKTCIVIPSRLGSTRLPEKALADINGKSMVQWVYERAKLVNGVDEVLIATDHVKIESEVKKFGGKSVMTPESLNSGTDRVAYVAKLHQEQGKKFDIYINVQGDEPTLDPKCVESSIEMVKSGKFTMATPAAPLASADLLNNKNVVKVLVDQEDRAVYFSRFGIPFSRGEIPPRFSNQAPKHHLGVYVYTAETLKKFAELPRCDWEAAESLEQLRALYYGIAIGVASAERATNGVDTLEDLEAVRKILK